MNNYTLTINKDTNVYQHEYISVLESDDFLKLMAEEWMIDENNGDCLTIEVNEPVL